MHFLVYVLRLMFFAFAFVYFLPIDFDLALRVFSDVIVNQKFIAYPDNISLFTITYIS